MSTYEEDFDVMMAKVELLIKNFKRTGRVVKTDQTKLVYSRPGLYDEKSYKTASFIEGKDQQLDKVTGKSLNEVSKSRGLCLMLDNEEEEERKLPWIIDSGYSTHMTRSEKKFISLQPHEGRSITFCGGTKGQIIGD